VFEIFPTQELTPPGDQAHNAHHGASPKAAESAVEKPRAEERALRDDTDADMPTLLKDSDSDSNIEEVPDRTTSHPADGTVEEDVDDEVPWKTRMRFTKMLSHDEPQQEPTPEESKPDPAQPDPDEYVFGAVLKSTRGAIKFIEFLVDAGRLTAEEEEEHRHATGTCSDDRTLTRFSIRSPRQL
jgi:hypothetical protein